MPQCRAEEIGSQDQLRFQVHQAGRSFGHLHQLGRAPMLGVCPDPVRPSRPPDGAEDEMPVRIRPFPGGHAGRSARGVGGAQDPGRRHRMALRIDEPPGDLQPDREGRTLAIVAPVGVDVAPSALRRRLHVVRARIQGGPGYLEPVAEILPQAGADVDRSSVLMHTAGRAFPPPPASNSHSPPG